MSRASSRVLQVDAARPTSPGGLQPPSEGRGEVVVVVADAHARDAGWVGLLVIDIAETWCAGESSVILADGDLTSSQLHELVGTPNVEGVSDLIRYGASTDRVARPVGSRGFRFVPKGTIVPDPEAVYGESRWSEWFDQVRESGVVLVLCLPREIDGVAALTEHADRVLLLTGDPSEAPDDDRVVVVRAEESEEGEDVPVSAGVSPEAIESIGTGTPSLAAPRERASASRKRESGIGKLLLLAFLVVVLVLVVAVSLGFLSIPGITVGPSPG